MLKDAKVIDIGKELKKAERREKFNRWKQNAKDWWTDNKQVIILVGPGVLAAGAKIASVIGKRYNLHVEERQKDLRVYDTSLGHYWELKRKLNNNDWTYINNERDRGISLGKILDNMKVLK